MSTIHTTVVRARPGEEVTDSIALALRLVADGAAYAYFDHQGVIVTVDANSTAASAFEDWRIRTGRLYDAKTKAQQ